MTKYQYYINNETLDGAACVVGTTYSFADEDELKDFAAASGWELEAIEAPEIITDDMRVW